MVQSIELVFDRDTEAAVRRIWTDLAAAGIPSQAPASRPHVSLVVAGAIRADVDPLLESVSARMPLPCVIGAPLLFGRAKIVLARLVVPTADLLAVQAAAYRLCGAHLQPQPMPHCRPDQWTPHVTLARRVGTATLARAVRIAAKPAQIDGRFAALRRWDGNTKTEHLLG
ncbi:2'-5' RNA ligase family protein [Mycobacterium sp.]|uniref:2'-5' RNA ligase family protein n=1 Tax=Mycobacterium sp. TaxID=1785 RepID=UPI001280F1BE|nr:2'-5' RNA ligase family protein [Mycobacterium sp.]KAA8964534.1 MAG: 2'-5' RNA ligase family protein [Mycobacterium sp.]